MLFKNNKKKEGNPFTGSIFFLLFLNNILFSNVYSLTLFPVDFCSCNSPVSITKDLYVSRARGDLSIKCGYAQIQNLNGYCQVYDSNGMAVSYLFVDMSDFTDCMMSDLDLLNCSPVLVPSNVCDENNVCIIDTDNVVLDDNIVIPNFPNYPDCITDNSGKKSCISDLDKEDCITDNSGKKLCISDLDKENCITDNAGKKSCIIEGDVNVNVGDTINISNTDIATVTEVTTITNINEKGDVGKTISEVVVDSTSDDSTGGDSSGDDSTGGDSTADDSSGDDSTGGDSTADDSIGGDSTADDSSGDDSTGGDSTADDSSGDHSTGDDSTGGDSTADDSTGDDSSGDDSSGDDSSGDDSITDDNLDFICDSDFEPKPIGCSSTSCKNDSSSESCQLVICMIEPKIFICDYEPESDDSSGDDSIGGDSTGDDSTGDDSTGDDSTGDDLTGDDSTGDDSTGDDSTGDDSTGDDSTGDDSSGDDSEQEEDINTSIPSNPDLNNGDGWWKTDYPDGISGIWESHQLDLKSTPIYNFVKSFSFSSSASSVPSFDFDFNLGFIDFGSYSFVIPQYIIDFIGLVLIISSLLLSRKLVFGG